MGVIVEKIKWRGIIILLILILISAAGFYIYNITDRSDKYLQIIAEEMNENEEEIMPEKEAPAAGKKKEPDIKTVDDIHRIYKRVETVQLMNGRELTGAVISTTSDEYRIVTVKGIVNIPMQDVKSRIIIR